MPPQRHVAVVVNPTKLSDLDQLKARVARIGAADGLGPAHWLPTTAEHGGARQTREAMSEGAEAVLACGGDGTVREVAAQLAGSSIPLGVLPSGTGNLFARNLSLPLNDLDAAIRVALSPTERRVDVARVEVDVSGEDDVPRGDTFLVMAGIGFDAEVMANVPDQLKERVGWMAYLVAGARRLNGKRTRVTLLVTEGAEQTRTLHRRVRSVIVGNCGELTGGFRLMPDAIIDDGWLDVAVVAPRGVVGWAAVVGSVFSRGRIGHPVVEHLRCRRIEVRAERPLQVQLDGDPAGTARVLRAEVQPGALLVRC